MKRNLLWPIMVLFLISAYFVLSSTVTDNDLTIRTIDCSSFEELDSFQALTEGSICINITNHASEHQYVNVSAVFASDYLVIERMYEWKNIDHPYVDSQCNGTTSGELWSVDECNPVVAENFFMDWKKASDWTLHSDSGQSETRSPEFLIPKNDGSKVFKLDVFYPLNTPQVKFDVIGTTDSAVTILDPWVAPNIEYYINLTLEVSQAEKQSALSGSANSYWFQSNNFLWEGQSFQHNAAFAIYNVTAQLGKLDGGAAGAINLTIWDCNGTGWPNNQLAILGEYDISDFTVYTSCTFGDGSTCLESLVVDEPYPIAADTCYVIVWAQEPTDQQGTIGVDVNDIYANGSSYHTDPGEAWQGDYAARTLYFQVNGVTAEGAALIENSDNQNENLSIQNTFTDLNVTIPDGTLVTEVNVSGICTDCQSDGTTYTIGANDELNWTIQATLDYSDSDMSKAVRFQFLNATTEPTLALGTVTMLNGTKEDDSLLRNETNLDPIEYLQINFTVNHSVNIDQVYLNFTMNSSENACSLGNLQSTNCYNRSNSNSSLVWIQFINNTETATFDDSGNVGDVINETIISDDGQNMLVSYLVDEHYQSVWKEYPYDFSTTKFQDGVNQRITGNKMIKIEVDNTNIPVNADFYKLDFRINYSGTPTQELEAYACNSSYTTGDAEDEADCVLVAQKNYTQLGDDGTKFRAIFSDDLITSLGDISYVVLKTDEAIGANYWFIKTYNNTVSEDSNWNFTTNSGTSWSNTGDNHKSELNLNWYTSGAVNSSWVYNLFVNDTDGNSATLEGNVTWSIGAGADLPPLVSINTPDINETLRQGYNITWTAADPEGTELNVSLILLNSDKTINKTIATSMNQSNSTYNWTFDSSLADGQYFIRLNATDRVNDAVLDDHNITLDNNQAPVVSLDDVNNLRVSNGQAVLNWSLTDDDTSSSIGGADMNITLQYWLNSTQNFSISLDNNDTEYNISGNVLPNLQYFWRVIATNPGQSHNINGTSSLQWFIMDSGYLPSGGGGSPLVLKGGGGGGTVTSDDAVSNFTITPQFVDELFFIMPWQDSRTYEKRLVSSRTVNDCWGSSMECGVLSDEVVYVRKVVDQNTTSFGSAFEWTSGNEKVLSQVNVTVVNPNHWVLGFPALSVGSDIPGFLSDADGNINGIRLWPLLVIGLVLAVIFWPRRKG